jgi:hypothetical protein
LKVYSFVQYLCISSTYSGIREGIERYIPTPLGHEADLCSWQKIELESEKELKDRRPTPRPIQTNPTTGIREGIESANYFYKSYSACAFLESLESEKELKVKILDGFSKLLQYRALESEKELKVPHRPQRPLAQRNIWNPRRN